MAERTEAELTKPFIVWVDYGSEGWSPTGYDTLKDAITDTKYTSRWIVTKRVEWEPVAARAEPREVPS